MALSQRLAPRQSRHLVMTPRLRRAIALLQLSNLDLAAQIETELQGNPLLERAAPEPPAAAGPGWPDRSRNGGSEGGDRPAPEELLRAPRTLRQHLLEQVAVDIAAPRDRRIARYLVGMLDEAGYLDGDFAQAARALGCSPAAVAAVLARLRHLDPPGVFARGLGECLAMQLRDRGRLTPAMRALLDNLAMLADGETRRLARLCGVDVAGLGAMIAEIRRLDPKPGLAFQPDPPPAAAPDILMRPGPDGRWRLELNPDSLPRILVNHGYLAPPGGGRRSGAAAAFLEECRRHADWLVRALRQRADTILKVAAEIVRRQDGFFAHGVGHLRPLTLREVADAVGLHESTVSRAVGGKSIETPRGVFALKFFFTVPVGASAGADAHSAEAVRHRIRAMIDAEEAGTILSDGRIAALLNDQGIGIARRTVAKYREALRIPAAARRRRQKAAGLAVPRPPVAAAHPPAAAAHPPEAAAHPPEAAA